MTDETDKLIPIVFAHELPLCSDCQEERYCPDHQMHYADCPCLGPSEAEDKGYEILEVGGRMFARKKVDETQDPG